MSEVRLQCSLCDMKLSATNESRIATLHLKNAACSKVKTDPETAAVFANAFIKSAKSASVQHDPDEQEALAQLQNKKRKASSQSSVADVFLSKEKQEAYTLALYDFFLENSDCVAMHACEHPALQKFRKMVGMPPLNRKVSCAVPLQGPMLNCINVLQ